MLNIKKQIGRLYSSAILGQLSLSGAWVAILASRGFSLAQIGFAETIFHIVSILFEIPSGVLADVFGRKKTLVISCLMRMAGNIVMIFSNNFAMVCISIGLHALCYNFSSGSGDALAYDSLKSVGEEQRFEKYASNQLVIYRACEGLSTLTAGFALILGYKIAYSTGVFASFIQLFLLAAVGLHQQMIGICIADVSAESAERIVLYPEKPAGLLHNHSEQTEACRQYRQVYKSKFKIGDCHHHSQSCKQYHLPHDS